MMTTSLTERFKAIRQELAAYADMDYRNEELRLFDQWAHQVTLSGALTTRNFEDIRALLKRAGESSHRQVTRSGWWRVRSRKQRRVIGNATAWRTRC